MTFQIPNHDDAANEDQSAPDAQDFAVLAAGIGRTGVVSGCAVTAQGTPDMTCAVAAGVITTSGGTPVAVSAGNVTITSAHATLPRFDLVVANASGTKSVLAGTPAASPDTEFPDIGAYIVLAAVYVGAAVTTIVAGSIVDKRVIVLPLSAAGESESNVIAARVFGG